MSRTPGNFSIPVVRGATWEDEFTYKNPDGTARDMTGYEARMQVRTVETRYGLDPEGDGVLLELSTNGTDGRIAWDTAATGRIAITVAAEDTVQLNPDNDRRIKRAYGLQFFIPDAGDGEYVLPIIEGFINVRGSIIRDD